MGSACGFRYTLLDTLAAIIGLAIRSFVGASVRDMVTRPSARSILMVLSWLHPLSWVIGFSISSTHGSLAVAVSLAAVFLMLLGSIKIEEREGETPVSRFLLRWFHTYGAVAMTVAIVPFDSLENLFICTSVMMASIILAVFLVDPKT